MVEPTLAQKRQAMASGNKKVGGPGEGESREGQNGAGNGCGEKD